VPFGHQCVEAVDRAQSNKVNSSTVAYLQGTTIPIPETANLSSFTTLPMDLELWHRHLCHPSFPVLRKMINENLVTGLRITSPSKPDPICKSCLAGKMVAEPFPSSSSHQSTSLLEIIHSDVHGPIRVPSHSGYIYWVTFIDGSGKFRAAYLMKKSDIFPSFKKYKAWAENQTGCRIKILREDKGGEQSKGSRGNTLSGLGLSRKV